MMNVAALPTPNRLSDGAMPRHTITDAAAAADVGLVVTDRRRHLPPRTLAPPRKQLSCTSALARVSYGECVRGGGKCRVLGPLPPLNIMPCATKARPAATDASIIIGLHGLLQALSAAAR